MAIEVVMPRMGLTMEEGTLLSWLKGEGEYVSKGESLIEIETDKTAAEIEAPGDGYLRKILVEADTKLPVGAILGYLISEDEELPAEIPGSSPTSATMRTQESIEQAISKPINESSKVKASPAARFLARQHKIDLRSIVGSGPAGRIVAWNVTEAGLTADVNVTASPVARRVAEGLGVDLDQIRGSGPKGRVMRKDLESMPGTQAGEPLSVVTPLSRTEQLIASRMVESFTSAPHFYLHVEFNARPLVDLREQLLLKLEKWKGVRITYTDLLIKFCSIALAEHPRMIAQWADGGISMLSAVNIGIATDTPTGLVVPVIHQADQFGLTEIAKQRQDLIDQAREGRLRLVDLEGGSFTISNLGMYSVDSFHAILNPPQAAILAVGRLKERPYAEDGTLIVTPTINLNLSIDHRVVDGATGARFLDTLVSLLETPSLALA